MGRLDTPVGAGSARHPVGLSQRPPATAVPTVAGGVNRTRSVGAPAPVAVPARYDTGPDDSGPAGTPASIASPAAAMFSAATRVGISASWARMWASISSLGPTP